MPFLYCIMVSMEKMTPPQAALDNKSTVQTTEKPLVLPENEEVFATYALWKSLPIPILKNMTREQITDKMGIDDEIILDLIEIPTQKVFAERYNLHHDTLSDWNNKIRIRDPLFEAKGWARGLAKNMVLSMYNHAIRKGNPLLMKLFFQVANDWQEKSTVEHDYLGVTEIAVTLAPKNISKKISQSPDHGETTDKDKLGTNGETKPSEAVPVG